MAAGRRYVAVLDSLAVTTAIEFFWATAPTDAVVYLEEVSITQDASETSEQLLLSLARTTTDSSGGGTGNTPNPIEVGDPAYGGTVRTAVAAASSADTTMIRQDAQNVLNGWLWKGSYEEPLLILSPTAGTASRMVLRCVNAPAASLNFSGYIILREIGG